MQLQPVAVDKTAGKGDGGRGLKQLLAKMAEEIKKDGKKAAQMPAIRGLTGADAVSKVMCSCSVPNPKDLIIISNDQSQGEQHPSSLDWQKWFRLRVTLKFWCLRRFRTLCSALLRSHLPRLRLSSLRRYLRRACCTFSARMAC